MRGRIVELDRPAHDIATAPHRPVDGDNVDVEAAPLPCQLVHLGQGACFKYLVRHEPDLRPCPDVASNHLVTIGQNALNRRVGAGDVTLGIEHDHGVVGFEEQHLAGNAPEVENLAGQHDPSHHHKPYSKGEWGWIETEQGNAEQDI